MTISNKSIIILLIFLLTASVFAERVSIINKWEGKPVGSLESFKAGRYSFVSITHFAKAFDLQTRKDLKAKRVILYLPDATAEITAISPFVKIDKTMFQMPISTLYRNGEFYVPLQFFTQLLKNFFPGELSFNQKDSALLIAPSSDHITSIDIEEMANGTLIKIKTLRPFEENKIFTSESNGWFYVDLYGGRVDTFRTFSVDPDLKNVKKIIPIQLSEETARLSFRVLPRIKEKNVYIDPNNEITITLRTKQDLSQDLLADLEKEREKWKIDTIVIDPGHGGRDPGAVGKSNLYEKNITLAIAKMVKDELEKQLDSKILMTRDNDTYPRLKDRTEFANKNSGKLFLSIHVDSNPSSRIHGHTIYFLGIAKTDEARRAAQFENSVIKLEDNPNDYVDLTSASFILAANAQNSYAKESEEFAVMIDNEIRKQCDSYSHGVRQAGFQVLYNASMPSILIETAYITNRYDLEKLKTQSYRQKLAKSISDGVVKFAQKYEESMN